MGSAGLPDLPFHDAEVLALRLGRDGPTLELDVEVFAQLPEARVVTLRFDHVTELELDDFNQQNVLWDIEAEPDKEGYQVTLETSCGLSGTFRCAGVQCVEPEREAAGPNGINDD